jgi:hypothetical protein
MKSPFDFSTLLRFVRPATDKHRELRAREQELLRQREVVMYAKTNRADVKAFVERWIDAKAAVYPRMLQDQMKQFLVSPATLDTPSRLDAFSPAGAVQPFGQALQGSDFDVLMCGLMGDSLKATLLATVEGMRWENEGLPMSERQAELSRLDVELAAVTRDIATLEADAERAGIRLHEVPPL